MRKFQLPDPPEDASSSDLPTDSREKAITKGEYVDVTEIAKEAGFDKPVALSAAIHSRLQPSERDKLLGQTFEQRVGDVLGDLRARMAIARQIGEPGFYRELNRETDNGTYSFDTILVENAQRRRLDLKADHLTMDRRLFSIAIMDKVESMDPAHAATRNSITSDRWERAIADGEFVDIAAIAKEAGFDHPVAISASVHSRLQPSERDKMLGQNLEQRVRDILMDLRARVADVSSIYNQIYHQWSPKFYPDHAREIQAGILAFDTILIENAQKKRLHLKAKEGPQGIVIVG